MAVYTNRTVPVEEHNHYYRSSNTGWIVGLIVLLLLAWMIFNYGIPALNSVSQSAQPQINVPDKIDVNVNQPAQ